MELGGLLGKAMKNIIKMIGQVLVAKLNALRMAGQQQNEQQVSGVSQELKIQMQQGAASSLSAIMAQGYVTRSLVEFALSD